MKAGMRQVSFGLRGLPMKRALSSWSKAAIVFAMAAGHALSAQEAAEPQPVAGAQNLLRLEGTDARSGIHYVRLFLSLPKTDAETKASPRFTVECTEVRGKHQMSWFMNFGGVDGFAFEPPFHPTQTDLFPPRYPSANLKMVFEGYTKSKPFVRAWAELPSGELRYRNPGLDSPNMESPQHWMQFLIALPGLRIGYAKPINGSPTELLFPTQPLLEELRKTPICAP